MIKLTNLLKESTELDKAKDVYNKAVDIQKEIDSLEKQKNSLVNQYADLRKGLLNAEYDRLIVSAKKLYPNAEVEYLSLNDPSQWVARDTSASHDFVESRLRNIYEIRQKYRHSKNKK
jgi:hypothetical protein